MSKLVAHRNRNILRTLDKYTSSLLRRSCCIFYFAGNIKSIGFGDEQRNFFQVIAAAHVLWPALGLTF